MSYWHIFDGEFGHVSPKHLATLLLVLFLFGCIASGFHVKDSVGNLLGICGAMAAS